ncbi:hypothetical protein [Streptomyces pinistramenti]|nr:hypothetical protein [Streptomyces pinistramenti]
MSGASFVRDLGKGTGRTGRELSARCGRHPAKTTRIHKCEAIL